MNNVFENNINNLNNDKLAQNIVEHKFDVVPKLEMTNGYNLSYKDKFIHNPENPLAEAVSIFNKSKNEENVVFVIYGIGLGYLFQVAAKEAKGQVLLYEPNLDILHTTLSLVDLSNELTKQNVHVFNDRDELKNYIQSNVTKNTEVQILSLASYREIFAQQFEEDIEIIRFTYGSNIIDSNFLRLRLQTATQTTIQNITRMINEIPINEFENIYEGETAIIVSAGPTLQENIETLKKYQDNAIIFTVGTAMKALVENNIKTDFLCMIEAFDNSKQVSGIDLKDVNLIIEPFTHKNSHLLEAKNKILHISDNMPPSKFFGELAGINTEGYITQGTVSFLALNSAVKMGFKKIILLGQDLAYIDGQCYAKNSMYDGLMCKFNEKTQKYEIVADDMQKFADSLSNADEPEERIETATNRIKTLNDALFTVKGINGKQIPTEGGYASFINHYAQYVKGVNERAAVNDDVIEFINTSMKGAQIDGFKNMSLEDAMKNSDKVDKKELNSDYKFDINKIIKGLEDVFKNLEQNLEIVNDYGKMSSRLSMDIKRNSSVDKDKLLKLRSILENYYKIIEPNPDNEIFRYITTKYEMDFNDYIQTVKEYDEPTLAKTVENIKTYYANVKSSIEETKEYINTAIEELKK